VKRRKRCTPAPVKAAGELAIGAAANLRRLEQCEASDYQAMLDANAAGDELLARVKRDAWLKSSDALRRHDLAVEQSRRDAGELVHREEVRRLFKAFGMALYHAAAGLESLAPEVAGMGDPYQIWGILHKTALSFGSVAAAAVRNVQPALPERIITDFTEGFSYALPADGQWAERLAVAIGQLMQGVNEDHLRKFRARVNVAKCWQGCSDPKEKDRIWHEQLNPQPGALPKV
jgi:hypothetical protein